MKARAFTMAAAAGLLSLGVHSVGLLSIAPPEPEGLAGGPVQLAMVGNSFEDATAGTLTHASTAEGVAPLAPQVTETSPIIPTPDRTDPTGPDSRTSAQSGGTPAARVQATRSPTPSTSGTARAVAPVTTPPVSAAPPALLQRPDPTRPASAGQANPPVAPQERIVARDAPVAQTPSEETPRPQLRQPRPPPPEPTPEPPRQAQTAPDPDPQPPPQPQPQPQSAQGTAPETTRAGQATGSQQGSAAQTQQGGSGQAATDGRAIARYPQLVFRRLSRLRQPNVRFDGATVIAFTVSANGGLSRVAVAQSSGNPEFDRMAVAHIQRAVPFPAPPAGAQRSFNVTIRGR